MPGLFPIQTVRPMAGVDLQEAHRRLGKLGVQAVLHQPRCGRGAALSVIFTAAHREADVERTVNAIGAALLGAAEGRLAVAG